MSLPSFPDKDKTPSRDEVINQIISSIAMEELGLSHIINAEGEKLQYALGTIPGITGPEDPLTMEELLKLNESIHKTLDSTMMNQFFLKEKLSSALAASVMQGPPGPVGTILDSYDTLEELKAEHPKGKQGDAYLVGGELYVWDEKNNEWKSVGDLTGPQGPQGPQGTGTTIKGSYDSKEEFEKNPPPGSLDNAYLVGGEIYIWNETDGWHSGGSLKGEKGDVGTILDSYDTLAELIAEHPEGKQGDAYLVGGDLYVWDTETGGWKSVGSLKGDKGDVGTILDSYDTLAELIAEHPEGKQGDAYLVDGELYIWNTTTKAWKLVGNLKGDKGDVGTILDSYDTYADFIADHPSGKQGDAYLVDGTLYVWDKNTQSWKDLGELRGLITGDTLFTVTDLTDSEIVPYRETLTFVSDTMDIKVKAGTGGPIVNIENPNVHAGAIIPLSCPKALLITTDGLTGAHNFVALIGTGMGTTVAAPSNPIIPVDLTSDTQVAFLVPTDGEITAMSVFIRTTALSGLAGANSIITAQIYYSAVPDNTFYPLDDARIVITRTGLIGAEVYLHDSVVFTNPIQVTAGTRLLMVFYYDTPGNGVVSGTTGIYSASIKIQ